MPYIGRSMSGNAKAAHERGLLPISAIGRKELDQYGFKYSVGFFRWLCKKRYIFPSEYHHTSAAMRLTKFYSPEIIRSFAGRANLSLLYDIYLGRQTLQEAMDSLGLRYYKVECVRSMLNVRGAGSLFLFVVYYRGAYYLSKKRKILKRDICEDQFRVLAEYQKGDPAWKNTHRKEIERFLFVYMSKYMGTEKKKPGWRNSSILLDR